MLHYFPCYYYYDCFKLILEGARKEHILYIKYSFEKHISNMLNNL